MFDENAIKLLQARYLNKDEDGNIIETVSEMFERVCINIAIPSLLYDKRVYGKSNKKFKENVDIEKYDGLKIGKYRLNRYHIETILRVYNRLNKNRKMLKPLSEILKMIQNGEFDEYQKEIDEYFEVMISKKFLPNTPALVNFGNPLGAGMACFALGIDDSIVSIMETLKNAAIIFQSGGGCGYNFSKIRPEGDFVKSTHGIASGPIAFMTLFDKMTEVIKQGGVRRGANMGILNSDHPDIEKFITAKKGNLQLRNFNISVLIKEEFWDYYLQNKPYPLVNPRNGNIVKYINPQELLDIISYQSWESAEPGVLFEDNINRYNPFLKTLGKIQTTNPCGEVLLYPNESCDLGSINLWAFVKEDKTGNKHFDWEELANTVKTATKILDNILDANNYPLKEIEKITLKTRKIGLGIMGLADTLFELGMRYDSDEGLRFMEKVMEFVNYHSKLMSINLAKERGSFPYFNKSFYKEGKMPFKGFYERNSWSFNWDEIVDKIKKDGLRNAYTTVVAPTGSISMIAGTSAGIEPVFGLVYKKEVSLGTFHYIDPVFKGVLEKEGLYNNKTLQDIIDNEGSCQNLEYIPKYIKDVFKTALDISVKDHIKALCAIQKWVDSSVSKTINFPKTATVNDIKEAYIMAHELGCKGLTVYRNKSIKGVYQIEKDNLCPVCNSELSYKEGCTSCQECGWGACPL